MRKHVLSALGSTLFLLAAAQAVFLFGSPRFSAVAAPVDLLKGCADVPEAVALAQTLQERALRIERYLQDMQAQKAEIATAREALTAKLVELRQQKQKGGEQKTANVQTVTDEIDKMVALYDQMKPDLAAGVISNMPPEVAAELLMRVRPENGARILAGIDPKQAALLTSYMGASSAARK
ncbi:MotE family protein [Paracoccus aminophilus]|uniref:Magnesium transporter MgtE intracellular domain-containing protein n=1 Tax=Paracoccus aminophilus JCM 7686 TaxID=1367847 RepID=S5XJT1_PARAH|nr:hypothetical protein [Paracoccus aminophilus]AGT07449.1 hypothetical protein JCM7686_0340 [Paracoccus aminophilus JCM 7686]